MNDANNNVPHAHPDEREMLRMKMAADRTRLEAAGRLASYEADVERDRLIGKLEVWGLAAVAGAVVFALLMREGPGQRMTSGLSRAAERFYRTKRGDQMMPRLREFIEGARR